MRAIWKGRSHLGGPLWALVVPFGGSAFWADLWRIRKNGQTNPEGSAGMDLYVNINYIFFQAVKPSVTVCMCVCVFFKSA